MNWIIALAKFALLILVIPGCTTFDPRPPIQLPVGLHQQFHGCYPADGAAMMRVFEKDRLQASTELEWIANDKGNWQADATTPFGQSLAGLLRKGRKVTTKGQYAERLPEIAINEDGFFEVDGNLLALRPGEVPCLLQNKLPRSWIPDLYEASENGSTSLLKFADGTRTIDLNLPEEGEVCAALIWGHYGGLVTSEVKWCYNKRKASLEGLGDTKLTWVLL